jgi:hypothetical protein
MPLIEVHLIENVFNPEQERQIIQKLTDAMVSIEGENARRDPGSKFQRHERRNGAAAASRWPPNPSRISQPDERRREAGSLSGVAWR